MAVRLAGSRHVTRDRVRGLSVRRAGARYGGVDRPNSMFLIAGQSNANGRGDTGDLTDASYASAFAAVQIFIKSAGAFAVPLVWQVDEGPVDVGQWFPGFVGAEVSLARDLDAAQPGLWSIAKMAIDGSGLFQHWRTGAGVPGVDSGGETSEQFIAFAQACALAQNADVRALLWIQGEQDAAIDSGFGDDYASYLAATAAVWRAALGNFVFLVVRLHADSNDTLGPNRDLIRAQQEAFVLADGNAVLIDVDDLTLQDTVHFDADSLVVIGQRAATAYLGTL